jgi:hypothetical protein
MALRQYRHLHVLKPVKFASFISFDMHRLSKHEVAFCKHQATRQAKVVPLHAMKVLEGRESIAPTHSRPRH